MIATTNRAPNTATHTDRHPGARGLTGLTGGVLMLGGFGLYLASNPPLGASPRDIAAFYQSSDRGMLVGMSWVAIDIGGLAVLFFLAGLCAALRDAQPASGRLVSVVMAAGSTAIGLLWVSFSVIDGLPGALRFDAYASYDARLDPHLHAVLDAIAYDTRSQACLAAAAMVGATALAARRTSLLPRWFLGASLAGASLLAIAPVVGTATMLLLPVWIATTAVQLHTPRPGIVAAVDRTQ